jgi:beta-N-acetylhexosaminidase
VSKYLRQQIGQLVMLGFPDSSISDDLRLVANEYELGGIILFGRNIEEPEQVAELAHDAQALSGESPLWVSVDQEGGTVARFREPFTSWPAMRCLGDSGDLELAKRFGRALARELLAVGVTLNYAPVLDVHTNAENPVIGERAFSKKPEEVARFGVAVVEGIQGEGVAACGKHFPGHGDTDVDSHYKLPVVDQSNERLRQVELLPFRAAVSADVAMIMTAHVLYPAVDEERPATISKNVITGVLRQELGFKGVVVTDDLTMKGITSEWSVEDAGVESIAAGCDLLLLCEPDVEQQVRTIEALIHAVENEVIPLSRIEDALRRTNLVKARFLVDAKRWHPLPCAELRAILGCDEHLAVAHELWRLS